MTTQEALLAVDYGMKECGGDPDQPYFYLGGPMTGIAEFNFPRFLSVQAILEDKGYNIISPADIEVGHDDTGQSYASYLERDFIICSLPNCVGGIFLEGWEKSRGARGETWLLSFLGKPIYQYRDGKCGAESVELILMDRDDHLTEHGIPNAGVPKDQQGLLTSGQPHSGLLPQHEPEVLWASSPGAVEIAGDFREPVFEGENQRLQREGRPGLFC